MSAGSDGVIRKLEGMQSQAGRYVLGKSRKDWSRTAGYAELNWLTITQTAVEASIRLLCKVIWNKKTRTIISKSG